jgi:hypothetical protein
LIPELIEIDDADELNYTVLVTMTS